MKIQPLQHTTILPWLTKSTHSTQYYKSSINPSFKNIFQWASPPKRGWHCMLDRNRHLYESLATKLALKHADNEPVMSMNGNLQNSSYKKNCLNVSVYWRFSRELWVCSSENPCKRVVIWHKCHCKCISRIFLSNWKMSHSTTDLLKFSPHSWKWLPYLLT